MSDEAGKAISAEADARYPRLTADGMRANRAFVAGAVWGRASRDAEVAELRDAFEEADSFAKVNAMNAADWFAMRTEVETLRQQLAEREAVIERVREWVKSQEVDHSLHIHSTDSPFECTCGPSYESREARDVAKLLTASPSTVLAEHDARVLEELIGRLVTVGWGRSARDWLRKRAAEYWKGAGQ